MREYASVGGRPPADAEGSLSKQNDGRAASDELEAFGRQEGDSGRLLRRGILGLLARGNFLVFDPKVFDGHDLSLPQGSFGT